MISFSPELTWTCGCSMDGWALSIISEVQEIVEPTSLVSILSLSVNAVYQAVLT